MAKFYRKFKKSYKKAGVSKAVKAYVKKTIHANIEDKQVTTAITSQITTVHDAWEELTILNPAQGDAMGNRTGRSIKVKELEFKLIMTGGQHQTAADDPFDSVRIVVGIWQQESPCAALDATAEWLPIQEKYLSEGILERELLYDKWFTLEATARGMAGDGDGYTPKPVIIKWKKYFKHPITITYGDDSTTYPNKYFVFSIISDSAADSSPVIYHGYTRAVFEDA